MKVNSPKSEELREGFLVGSEKVDIGKVILIIPVSIKRIKTPNELK